MTQALQQSDTWPNEPSEAYLAKQALSKKEWKELQRRAQYHYEKSLDAKTRSEQTVAHRGYAKNCATKLRNHEPSKVTALNLLARIALDEGFYKLAEHYLTEAIEINPKDSGCWYSLGHVRLAIKDHTSALQCFSQALDISPKETRAATSMAYTLAKQGRVVEAFQAYRNLFRVHPKDQHIQAKLFEILKNIKADFYQADLEVDVITWLKMTNVNHQALAPLVMSLLKHKYRLSDPNSIIDLQDLAKDDLLGLSLGKLYFTDNELESFLIIMRKQVLLHAIASEYSDTGLLRLAGKLAMHAEHNEHIYIYDKEEKDLISALHELISDAINTENTKVSDFPHLITLYAMYEPLLKLKNIETIQRIKKADWPEYSFDLIQHAVVHSLEEIELMADIDELSPIVNQISKNVKQQYEENPYPRWLHMGYNTPTNYGRALETELAGFRAPDFFNMGPIKVLIAGSGTGQHALRVARYFRNVEVLAVDLSKRSLAYSKRMADKHNVENIRFLSADILELDALDEQFHVIECSGVLHHMKKPAQGLAMLKAKLAPRGLIKLGLYSFKAREIIRQMRDLIKKYELPATVDGIRTLRQAILEGKMPYDFSGILASQDFFSLSGCRDLLFHVQELQYEPNEIDELLKKEKLKFLGFVVPEGVRIEYSKQFPKDLTLTQLTNWQLFEEQFPTTFSGMFQFYIQKA